MHFKLKSY